MHPVLPPRRTGLIFGTRWYVHGWRDLERRSNDVTLALLTGAAVLEATPGKGKGRGQTKVTICHYQGTHNGTPKYKTLKLGAPGAENHLTHHELGAPFVDCCPGDTCASKGECFTTVGCEATGACAYTVNVSAPCARSVALLVPVAATPLASAVPTPPIQLPESDGIARFANSSRIRVSPGQFGRGCSLSRVGWILPQRELRRGPVRG
jgi:hypothetical protein